MTLDEQMKIRDALTIIEGQTLYMQDLGFAPQSCNAILQGVNRIMEVVNAPNGDTKTIKID